MDYGATIVKILAPDRNGKLEDVSLGFDQFAPYLRQTPISARHRPLREPDREGAVHAG